MKNYKTTILGALLAVLSAWLTADFEHLDSPKTIFSLVVSGGVALIGFLMKDDVLKKKSLNDKAKS